MSALTADFKRGLSKGSSRFVLPFTASVTGVVRDKQIGKKKRKSKKGTAKQASKQPKKVKKAKVGKKKAAKKTGAKPKKGKKKASKARK